MSKGSRGYSNPSQLLQRNAELLEADHLLVAGMPADLWLSELACEPGVERISAFTTDFDVYSGLQQSCAGCPLDAHDLHFGVSYDVTAQHDLLVLYARKGRDETELLLRLLLPSLKPGARILLVGENKAGIKSQGRLLEPLGSCGKIDSARHCTLFSGNYEKPQPAFNLDQVEKRYQFEVAGVSLTVCSLPGVFSFGRLDDGTRLLLEQLPRDRLSGAVLDFGCGAGVIGAWVQAVAKSPVKLTLLDNSALALEAARRTMAANGTEDVELLGSDGLSQVKGRYRYLLTNPPFHTGVKTNYAVTETFLAQVPGFLEQAGELWVVANSFLKYPPIIEKSLGNCCQVIDDRRFSIYSAKS